MTRPPNDGGLRGEAEAAENSIATTGKGTAETDTFGPFPALAGELAECAAVGAAMWSPEAARGVVEHLTADMFTSEACRLIFEAITAIVADGEHVDTVTVTIRLADDGHLDNGVTAADVFDVHTLEYCPCPAAWRTYARAVWRAADRRRQVREHLDGLRALGVDVQEVAA